MKQSFSIVFVVSLPGRRISDVTLSFMLIYPLRCAGYHLYVFSLEFVFIATLYLNIRRNIPYRIDVQPHGNWISF